MTHHPKSSKLPVWKSSEEIAGMLEKILTPTAFVKHNVMLPVIGQPNRKPRQCDVVITYGDNPRQIIAIVEVQKRKKRPDINTFQGWLAKMREVGAQQLICVSALGYPQSIIDLVATQIGPTVKLMTLHDLELSRKPDDIFMIADFVTRNPKFEVLKVDIMKLKGEPSKYTLNLSSEDKVFSIAEDANLINLHELISNALNNTLPPMFGEKGIDEPLSYPLELVFDSNNIDVWFHHDSERNKVKEWHVYLKITVNQEVQRIPFTQFAYRQENIEGTLAWIATANFPFQGKDLLFQIVLKPDKDGYLRVAPNLQYA